ncbi:MAG: SDR family oxidoreductase [Clostridiales bacterium]|nr:SDR family oxidoreductase [Clostridiales bacterium]
MKLPFKVDLSGKVVVVTGGTGVLGGIWVDALVQCGARIALLGRSKEKLQYKIDEIEANGGTAIGVEVDILSRESLSKARQEILDKLGPCDILLNGAGGNHPRGSTSREYLYPEDLNKGDDDTVSLFDLDEEGIRYVFDLNYLGTFLPCQEFVKDMVGREGCSIINVSSMNAFTPLTKIPAYSGAKAAISNFTRWLSVHLSKVGVRVNAIAPGFFLTNQNKELLLNEDGEYTERAKKIIDKTPMERFGRVDELVGVLLFLVSEEASSFVNGVVIPVDGGFCAYSGV